MRSIPFLLVVALCALSGACAEPCLDLAKKVCNCNTDPQTARRCVSAAEAQSANTDTSGSEDNRCDDLLSRCDCSKLDTPEGREACGLARAP